MNVLEKLQARASGVDQFYGSTDEELDREAIAEIERLQADNAVLAESVMVLRRERDGLRAALEGISTMFSGPYSAPEQTEDRMRSIAEDALSGHQQSPCTRCGGTKVEKATAGDGYHKCPNCS